ncbi:hypothetical protein AB6802_11330 [Mesorhizobium sp. RCC_202]|uniref:hypothetical protein n=1 Tax=Mesorhizobium sp. RCC_202 TaxID=3239222 RepID=UPI003523B1D2
MPATPISPEHKNNGKHLRYTRILSRTDKHLPIRLPEYWRSRILERQTICRFRGIRAGRAKLFLRDLANIGFQPTSIPICPTKPIFRRVSKLIVRQLIDAPVRIRLNAQIAPVREEVHERDGSCAGKPVAAVGTKGEA